MALQYSSGFCNYCDRDVKLERSGTNHILHLLLSVITGGLWLIVWVLSAIKFGGWRCSACGKTQGSSSGFNTFFVLVVGGLVAAIIWSMFN